MLINYYTVWQKHYSYKLNLWADSRPLTTETCKTLSGRKCNPSNCWRFLGWGHNKLKLVSVKMGGMGAFSPKLLITPSSACECRLFDKGRYISRGRKKLINTYRIKPRMNRVVFRPAIVVPFCRTCSKWTIFRIYWTFGSNWVKRRCAISSLKLSSQMLAKQWKNLRLLSSQI